MPLLSFYHYTAVAKTYIEIHLFFINSLTELLASFVTANVNCLCRYEEMQLCWNCQPDKRPEFSELVAFFEGILKDSVKEVVSSSSSFIIEVVIRNFHVYIVSWVWVLVNTEYYKDTCQ